MFWKYIFAFKERLIFKTPAESAHKYTRTPDEETLLSHSEIEIEEADSAEKPYSRPILKSRRDLLLLFTSLFFATTSALLLFAYITKNPSSTQCAKQVNTYSPLLDSIEYEDVEFENFFDHKTVYRGPPTNELEAEWKDLWFYDGVTIPAEKLPSINRTASAEKYRTTDGGKSYHALIEVFHQLHCLNIIRQYTWKDYYLRHPDRVETPRVFKESEVGARMHADHCIEALRIALMCHGDTTPYLIIEDPEAPLGFLADFSPHHKCVKFDSLNKAFSNILILA
ncbi:hypothetical protein G7Y89_g13926 [Cudoniella acicularis]|uniref:Cyclochlorotine biosynthesis protein O n=1 Tax=Cudoniella acicularis TaxID=354080 RepID=A0A8H4R8V0_9HELO|nr:hypothetical protein G7Y89_g13926 [Cudoniella acicularis]